ncbi:MAG: leucine-rich repeat domain-containing protein [Christensenella sp.]
MVSRIGKGKHGMRRFARSLALILMGILCVSLFCAASLAEEEFRAQQGKGWSLTADGVLTIESNDGWKDYLKDGQNLDLNKLIIGKNLTKFYLYDEMFEKVESDFQFPYEEFTDQYGDKYYSDGVYCPMLRPKEIEVQEGNPVFTVEDGLLVNNKNHTGVLADSDQRAFVIPEGVTTIGTWAFREREVETVQFPSTLQTIGIASFFDCENLKELEFPSSLTTILADAFLSCENVDRVVLPKNLKVIGSGAFSSCGIHEIVFPSGIQVLETGIFNECKNLKRVVLQESIKRIENTVFRGCTSLTEINLPEGLETIGAEAFQGCENLTQIALPSTLTVIGDDAFHGCEKLMDVTLPESLQEIGPGAFLGTDFTLLELSKTIKIGAYAFGHIHIAVFPSSENEIGENSFRLTDELIFLENPPKSFPMFDNSGMMTQKTQVFYTEDYADAWKSIAENGLNGWPTTCISREEAQTRIAQAAVPTPEPTADEGPWATDAILGMHISTPEPYTQPDQPTADIKTDPLVYVLAGLLALVAAGIVVIGVKTRKKQHGKPNRKG